MKRQKTGIFFLILAFLFSGTVFGQIKTDRFFPDSTKGYFSIANAPALLEQWNKTELGSLINSEPFAEFRAEFSEQLEKSWMGRFGMSFQDTIAIASGEIGGGLVAVSGKTPGFALIIDVTGRDAEVKEFLSKLIRKATDTLNGESRQTKTADGSLNVTVLTLPPDDKYPIARTIYYTQFGNYLLTTDQADLLEVIAGQRSKPLDSLPAYQATISRCTADYERPAEPQIRFFISPLEFGEAIHSLRMLTQEEQRKTTIYSVLAKQGFNGIQGIGGTTDLISENFEAVSRIKVYVPQPPTLSLKMLAFQDTANLTGADWIDQSVNRCGVFNIDLLTLFNNIGPLFNDFLETPGVWEETLQSLEKDERGPKVNLKTQLIAHLGSRISMLRTFRQENEKFVAGVDIKSGQAAEVASVMHRMFDTDPDFQKVNYENDVIWLYAPQQRDARTSERSSSSRRPRNAASGKSQAPASAPRGMFFVADDTLFISNDIDTLKETVEARRAGSITPIEQSADYQTVMKLIQNFSGGKYFFHTFADNQEGMRVNYELMRAGKFAEGKTLMARSVRALLAGPQQNTESGFHVDGSKLPPFSTMENQIGPSGYFGCTEADGWFFKGFFLSSHFKK